MVINNFIFILFCTSIILFSCVRDDKPTNSKVREETNVAILEKKQTEPIEVDSSVNLTPCTGIIKDLESISYITHLEELIADWTQENIFLSDFTRTQWFKSNFSVESLNYSYKDSLIVYVHKYKYLHKEAPLDITKIIKNLNGKKLYFISTSKLGERIFMYFIEETDDYDILVIDIPPNWESSYELREEFKQKLLEAFSCTFLLCDESDPCKFYNVASGAN